MSGPSKSNLQKPESGDSFAERIDMLFEELSFAIQWQRPSILLVFCESEYLRDEAEAALKKHLAEIGQRLVQFPVDEGQFDIPRLLSEQPDMENSVYSVTGLRRGGGKEGANAYRSLNMRREYFVDYSIRALFWLDGDEAIALARHAPDFWAFRHRVVELNGLSEEERQAIPTLELPVQFPLSRGQLEELDEQIESNEALLGALPRGTGASLTRMELLSRLAGLYQAKRAYDQSIPRLKRSIIIAKQVDDPSTLAKLWGSLGSVYLDSEQFSRAIRAYRKAIRVASQETGLWIGLGQTYRKEKRPSDAIIAFKQAIRLDPQNSTANSALAECYRLLGKDDLDEAQGNKG